MDDLLKTASPVCSGSGDAREKICVMEGVVYLPEGRTVAVESSEFDQLLRKNLPPEIAPDVVSQWKGGAGRITRFQWLGTILVLLSAGAFLYYFFPKVKPEVLTPQPSMAVVDFSRKLRSNSPYRGEYDHARQACEQGNYHDAVRILKSSVTDIIRTGDRNSDPVMFLYFHSLLKLKDIDPDGAEEAVDQLRVLREFNPDNPAWAQFAFELDPRIRRVRNYAEIQRMVSNSVFPTSLREGLFDIDYALKQLRIMRTLVNPVKFSADQLKQYREHFDLFEVQLRISRWLLLGALTGKSALPDNLGDPGVDEREKALLIARKHESSSCEDFWLARKFIAETLCRNDSLFNHIYWNGQYLKTTDLLLREIGICNQRLNGRMQP
ncbi:MAG: hypothetical protein J5858_09530 [Lentisphaeria bacterium]|nr:hypothetical protein [Lentisphaeria bacterium]